MADFDQNYIVFVRDFKENSFYLIENVLFGLSMNDFGPSFEKLGLYSQNRLFAGGGERKRRQLHLNDHTKIRTPSVQR